jgi:hypothetical protein
MSVFVLRISSKGSLTVISSGASPLLHAAGRRQDMNDGYRKAIHCERTGVQMAITRSGSWATFPTCMAADPGENGNTIFTRCKQTKAGRRVKSKIGL